MEKGDLPLFILKKMQSGEAYSQIKDRLINDGYSEGDIDAAYSLANSQPKLKLEFNRKAISKHSGSDAMRYIVARKRYIYFGFIGLLVLLAYTYIKKMSLETFSRTAIVGLVYFLMILAVIIIESILVKAAFVSARKRDEPGMFKDVFMMIIAADFFMLFLIPFTWNISLWIAVIPAALVFGMIMMVFSEYNLNAVAASALSYCFLNYLILFLMQKTATPQIILRFFIGG